MKVIYKFKVWSLCTYITTNTIKKQNLSTLISFTIIEERWCQDQEERTSMESVAYYTHSSQDREYMSCHGGATRGIIKSEVAKSVSKRERNCVSKSLLWFLQEAQGRRKDLYWLLQRTVLTLDLFVCIWEDSNQALGNKVCLASAYRTVVKVSSLLNLEIWLRPFPLPKQFPQNSSQKIPSQPLVPGDHLSVYYHHSLFCRF